MNETRAQSSAAITIQHGTTVNNDDDKNKRNKEEEVIANSNIDTPTTTPSTFVGYGYGYGNKKWIIGFCIVAFFACGLSIPGIVNRANEKDSTQPSDLNSNTPNGYNNSDETNKEKKESTKNSSSTTNTTSTDFIEPKTIFEISIEYLTPDVIKGYSSRDNFIASIDKAADIIMDDTYRRNIYAYNMNFKDIYYDYQYYSIGVSNKKTVLSDSTSSKTLSSLNSFGMPTRDDGIDDGDLVVSDGTYVYAAYGPSIVVWDVQSGDIINKISIPLAKGNSTTFDFPQISSLVLHNGRLLVLMTGNSFDQLDYTVDKPCLIDFKATQIRLYDTSAFIGSQNEADSLISASYINGLFLEVSVVNGIVYIGTKSSIDITTYLVDPLQRNMTDASLTNAQYTESIEEIAPIQRKIFRDRLLHDLEQGNGGTSAIPNLARISVWQENQASAEDLVEQMSTLILVFSLDMSAQNRNAPLLLSSSGTFVSSYPGFHVGGDFFFVSNTFSNNNEDKNNPRAYTSFLAITLNGTVPGLHSVGTTYSGHIFGVDGNFLYVRNDGITVMEMHDSPGDQFGSMEKVGQLNFIDYITYVKYFDRTAYVSTDDQLYVVDLSTAQDPTIASEVNMTGHVHFLLSLNEEHTLLLGIGQAVNATSKKLIDMQLTLFDTSNLTSPIILDAYVFSKDGKATAFTTGLFDPKSIRYVDGYLVIPLDYTYSFGTNGYFGAESDEFAPADDKFRGFALFTVRPEDGGIKEMEECRVTYNFTSSYGQENFNMPPLEDFADWSSVLSRRSFIVNGTFMTMENSEITLLNLTDCHEVWKKTLHPSAV